MNNSHYAEGSTLVVRYSAGAYRVYGLGTTTTCCSHPPCDAVAIPVKCSFTDQPLGLVRTSLQLGAPTSQAPSQQADIPMTHTPTNLAHIGSVYPTNAPTKPIGAHVAGDRWQPINQLEKQCWRRVGDAPSVFSAPLRGGGEILTECGERGVVACPHVTPYMCNALPHRCVVDAGGCDAFGGLRPCAAVGFDMLGFPALIPLRRQTETVTRVKVSAINTPGAGAPVATCPASHQSPCPMVLAPCAMPRPSYPHPLHIRV